MKITNETIRAKNAKLKCSLRTDSGMRSTSDSSVSALQWAAISAICAETEEALKFMDALAERIVAP